MDTRVYIYYCFLVACFIISLFNYKNDKGLNLISLLLFLSVFTELLVEIFKYWHINKSNHYILYHLFTPIEYCLVAGYYYCNIKNNLIKKIIVISIILFCIVSALISFNILPTGNYPSLNNQINYVLIIGFSIITLLQINPNTEEKLLFKAVFWIALGFTIYCTGIFFFNSLYNYLNQKNPLVAKGTFNLINSIFNDILYTLISIGFICSRKIKKYSRQ